MRNKLLITVIILVMMTFSVHAEYHLTKDDIYTAIQQEFANQGMDNVELEIFGGQTNYYFEHANDVKIMTGNLDLDEKQGRFEVTAEIFADGISQSSTQFIGRYYKVATAFVPSHDISKESLITESDLQETKMRENRLKDVFAYNKEDLIGQQAKKKLKAGKLIDKNDLQAEIAIKKGQTVTVSYHKKGLQITSKMQALDNAAVGQKIKLLNLNSKKEIIGTVKATGLVEISNE